MLLNQKPKSAFIEDMASESDDGGGGADSDDDDDDEDEGEDRNEYENDGFVVDDEDDEGSDVGETGKPGCHWPYGRLLLVSLRTA